MRGGGLLCMMAIRNIIVVLFFFEQDLLEMKIKYKQDCLLQGQAQLEQRVVFCFHILRLRSKKQ